MESKENSNSSWLDRWRGLEWKYQALAISLILVVIIISITAGVLSSGGNQGMYAGIRVASVVAHHDELLTQ